MAVDLNNPQVAEVLAQIRAIDWYQFEKLIALLFEDAGYKVERRGGPRPTEAWICLLKSPNMQESSNASIGMHGKCRQRKYGN